MNCANRVLCILAVHETFCYLSVSMLGYKLACIIDYVDKTITYKLSCLFAFYSIYTRLHVSLLGTIGTLILAE